MGKPISHESIQSFFPNFPIEVIDLWIFQYAQSRGWPPDEQSDQWRGVLAGRTTQFWQNTKWQKVDLELLPALSDDALFMIHQMYQAYEKGERNSYWSHLGQGGKERFEAAYQYLTTHGIFPQPPILLRTEKSDFDIIDGNHRILAL